MKIFFLLLISLSSFANQECVNEVSKKYLSIMPKKYVNFSGIVIKNGKTISKINSSKKHAKYNLASMSKQFTGISISILEDAGLLSINDYASKYINLPQKYKHVKIKHLLFHTSNIPDYLNLTNIDTLYKKKKIVDNAFINTFIKTQKPLQHENGMKYSYSNTNYVLLTRIIENITKKPFKIFIKDEIFTKSGLKNINFTTDDLKDEAFTQFPVFKKVNQRSKVIKVLGDQGVYMTIDDFEKYAKSLFFDNSILNQDAKYKVFHSGSTDNGDMSFVKNVYTGEQKSLSSTYSYGFRKAWLDEINDEIIFHCGELKGYNSCFIFNSTKNTLAAIFGNFNFPMFDAVYDYIRCFDEN